MMPSLHTYLPQDRLRALALGAALPDRANGTALFADISGFTGLAEKLAQELGSRRGGEELSIRLNQVYDALIGALEQHGGSVISFAGDAITCWFENKDENGNSAFPALAAAHAMQAAMRGFPTLALKISIASGPVRRFVVGNPQVQLLDALAGATLVRMSAGERLARKGEILADEATLGAAGDKLRVDGFRASPDGQWQFGVIQGLEAGFPANSGAPSHIPTENLPPESIRSWILPAVYEREQAGLGGFLTELRNAVALFLRFDGIDYDNDEAAGQKLDVFVRAAQEAIARQGGTLLALVLGDKNNYIYAAFGAPVAHEDDPRRALKCALELRAVAGNLDFLSPVQVGVTLGLMRAGAYGSAMRRTYSALGDEVNLAARLMSAACPAEIYVSERLQSAAAEIFRWQALPPLVVRGKSQPVSAFLLLGEQQRQAIRLQEPKYALPMVGRRAELRQIEQKMSLAGQGKGQLVGIVAEAGMGKSRLVAEAIRLAHANGFTGYGGACQSDGCNTPYLPWKAIWTTLLDVETSDALPRLTTLVPARADALPLLSTLVDIPFPENQFTGSLEPQFRKSTLHALLADLLRAVTQAQPTLLVLEDWHWVDALSQELLNELAQVIRPLPVLVVLAYRPPERSQQLGWQFEEREHFTRIALSELSGLEAEQAVRAKLGALFGQDTRALPSELLNLIVLRAQGNPFFLEELVNYLRDKTDDLTQLSAASLADLPDSLHALILSRIDQLSEHEKTTLKVASVIGRVFRASWLAGYYPELGKPEQIRGNLKELAKLDITLLETPEPELAYLFKHIVTREVAYESLAFTTRAQLHEQFARYIENIAGEQVENYTALLAYHYDLSGNLSKRCEYLTRAGRAAARRFANADAVDYFTRALRATPPDAYPERFQLLLERHQIYALTAHQREAQRQDIEAMMSLAEITANLEWQAQAAVLYAEYLYDISDLPGCEAAAAKASQVAQAAKRLDLEADARYHWASALYQMSQYAKIMEEAQHVIDLGKQLNKPEIEFRGLQFLGSVAEEQGNYPQAQKLYNQCLSFAEAARDLMLEEEALLGLGWVTWSLRDYAQSQAIFERAIANARKVGDLIAEGNSLSGLGTLAWSLGDTRSAWDCHDEMINIYNKSVHQAGESLTTNTLGWLAWLDGDFARARQYLERALALIRAVQRQREEGLALWRLGHVAFSQGNLAEARACYQESVNVRKGLGHQAHLMEAYAGLLRVAVARHVAGDPDALPGVRPIVEEIYQYLEGQIPEGAEAPFWIYLSLCQALTAVADPRAAAFLQKTRQILEDHASRIPDPAVRTQFLTKLPYHRELVEMLKELKP